MSALSLLALPLLALGAPASASAPTVRPAARHLMATLGSAHLPTDNRLPLVGAAPVGLPLQYGGGAVELTNRNYAIYWEPTGGTPVSPTYHALIERFFGDVGGSALFDTTTEYYQGSSATPIRNVSTFGGSYVETKPFPAGGVTDADLQAEVAAVAGRLGWATGVGNEVFVYTGPGGETVSQYCAYHSFITLGGKTLAYADEPYGGQSGCTVPSSPNDDPAADSIINTTSHELWETITDPNTRGRLGGALRRRGLRRVQLHVRADRRQGRRHLHERPPVPRPDRVAELEGAVRLRHELGRPPPTGRSGAADVEV